MKKRLLFLSIFSIFLVSCSQDAVQNTAQNQNILMLEEQGSFAIGGDVFTASGTFDSKEAIDENPFKIHLPDGQTNHGNHTYVFYQKPINAKKYPLVMVHGGGQSAKTWESTPDGRDGFQNIFLKRNFSVYLIDQPGMARASKINNDGNVPVAPMEQYMYNFFRIGLWPERFDGVQFPSDEESLSQYFRQAVARLAPTDTTWASKNLSLLFDKIGEGILIGHSQGFDSVLETTLKNNKIKAVVLYEPGAGFLPFPKGKIPTWEEAEMPDSIFTKEVSDEEIQNILNIPIVVYFGDNIPTEKSEYPILEEWRTRVNLVKEWAKILNEKGGNVEVIVLPEIGIKGNTHFPFSDLNNIEIANLLEKWFEKNNLN